MTFQIFLTFKNFVIMKSKVISSFLGLVITILFLFPIKIQAQSRGWNYKSVESIDRMGGSTYLVTHCEDKIGDDCTTPGTATRIDISAVISVLEAAGILIKMD